MATDERECVNGKCLGGANCPGHPWREDELGELQGLEAASRDMNDAAYRGAGFRQARKFFQARVEAAEQRVSELEELNRQRNLRDDQMIAVEQQRSTRAEAKLATVVEALRGVIDAYDGWSVNAYPADGGTRFAANAWFAAAQRVDEAVERARSEIEQGDTK